MNRYTAAGLVLDAIAAPKIIVVIARDIGDQIDSIVEAADALAASNGISEIRHANSEGRITFGSGTRVMFAHPSRTAALRGLSIDVLVIRERDREVLTRSDLAPFATLRAVEVICSE